MQFHPEVTHTRQGMRMLERFVRDICQCEALWTPAKIIDDAVERIRQQVGDDKVIPRPLRRRGLLRDRDAAAPRHRQKT
ncbi:hypothetical protein LNP25_32050 [Klebsiella variicola subsp. variicola]|nr:hypothetical protein [Klebsiella variicola subsp. variicola]